MITVRPAKERGHFNHGWLDTYHTFSFDRYHDPAHMGFRTLRVINEDRVAAGNGFGMHPHRDMEIVTYVLEGALSHKDSMGNGSTIRPGDVQRMSAGTGVRHSEFNHSQADPVHLLQIWILPEARDLEPSYEQKTFSRDQKLNRLLLVASRSGRDGSLSVHQDVELYAGVLQPGQSLRHAIKPGRHAWLQVADSSVSLNGTVLSAGDGAAVSREDVLELTARGQDGEEAEILLLDLS